MTSAAKSGAGSTAMSRTILQEGGDSREALLHQLRDFLDHHSAPARHRHQYAEGRRKERPADV